MVGVAGRSKGCHTCRRRKIRCDQRKPNCERCERTGRECEGYARSTIFLNQTGFSTVPDRARQSHSPPDGDARIQFFAATAETYKTAESSGSKIKDISGLPSPDPSVTSTLPSSSSTLSLIQTASAEQLTSMCLDRICPLRSQQKTFSLWILAPGILSSSKQESVFLHAFNALKLSVPYGTENADMVARSRVEYGKALQAMQKAIADQKHISDQTLMACTILKQYELQEVSSRTAGAFDAHVNGHLQLIKLRGAASFKSTFGRAMVREIRYLDVLASLSAHSRGELISAEWRCPTIWTDDHDIRLSLLDVASDAGAVYEDLETLGVSCDTLDRIELLNRVSKVQQDLFIWHQRVMTVAALSPPWPDCEEAPDGKQCPPVATSEGGRKIIINSLEQKYLMLDFWAISLITNQLISILQTTWPREAQSCAWPLMKTPERSLEHRQLQLATNILKIAPPCIADKCGIWGMLRSAWGLRNAYTAARQFSSPEAADVEMQLENILARMAARDFRKAPPMIESLSTDMIESSYHGSIPNSVNSLRSDDELPEVLSRATI